MALRTAVASASATSVAASALVNASGFAHDVLAPVERRGRHGKVLGVRRADVDGVNRRIPDDGSVIVGGHIDTGTIGERARLFSAASDHSRHVDKTEAPDRFQVGPAHEARSDNGRTETCRFHREPQRISEAADGNGVQ